MDRSYLLSRDLLELRRKIAKGYTCPVCAEMFSAEPKLWQHGVQTHTGYLGTVHSSEKDEGQVRKLFLQKTLDETQQIANASRVAGHIVQSKLSYKNGQPSVARPRRAPYYRLPDLDSYWDAVCLSLRSVEAPRANGYHSDSDQRSHVDPPHYTRITKNSRFSYGGADVAAHQPRYVHSEPVLGCTSPEAKPGLLLQPKIRPNSHEQLVFEVKDIVTGLILVEAKCIEMDGKQVAAAQEKNAHKSTKLNKDQLHSSIELHKQLLHEHHDFFLASQPPSAGKAFSGLATKYAMPARMWGHAIHGILRHRLPDSVEHTLTFLYIAYSMMRLLYETVSIYADTWIDSLVNLGRYRMAIENNEPEDREVCCNVTRLRYEKACNEVSNVGRLSHHLAISAGPYTWEQLTLCLKTLAHLASFGNAHGSIAIITNFLLYIKHTFHGLSELPGRLLLGLYLIPVLLYTRWYSPSVWLDGFFFQEATGKQELLIEPGPCYALSFLKLTWPRLLIAWLCLIPIAVAFLLFNPPLWQRTLHGPTSRVDSFVNRSAASIKAVSRPRRRSHLSTFAVLTSLLLHTVEANPISKPEHVEPGSSVGSFPFMALASLTFAMAVLFVARYLAPRKGPIRVWGCVMASSAYTWLMIRNDSTTTLSLSTQVFGVWSMSTFQYGLATFRKSEISDAVVLAVLLLAMILDLSIVSFMTPAQAVISQSDLINVFLPSISLALAITVNLIASIKPSPGNQTSLQGVYDTDTTSPRDGQDRLGVGELGQYPSTLSVKGHGFAAELATS